MANLLGRDIQPAVGLRVSLTAEGQDWEISKSGRGDLSKNQPGTIVDIAENGLICCVKWDSNGVVQRYPAGVMNRYYLSWIDDRIHAPVAEDSVVNAPQTSSDHSGEGAAHMAVDPAEIKPARKDQPSAKSAAKSDGPPGKEDRPHKTKDRKRNISRTDSKTSNVVTVEASESSALESPSVSSAQHAHQSPAVAIQNHAITSIGDQTESVSIAQRKSDPNSIQCRFLIGGRWRQVCLQSISCFCGKFRSLLWLCWRFLALLILVKFPAKEYRTRF